MTRTKDFYLLLLAYTLIEVRSLRVEGDPELAAKLADLFHNLPEALRLPWTEEREARIYQQVRAKAEVHGLVGLLDRWERRGLRRMSAEEAGQQGAARGEQGLC